MTTFPDLPPDRRSLQQAGNKLDSETRFRWIANEVAELERLYPKRSLIVDSARVPNQVKALRASTSERLTHVHLAAHYDHVVRRYSLRSRSIDAGLNYSHLTRDISESWQSELEEICDLRLNTEEVLPAALAEIVLTFLHSSRKR
jgi:hypothetical protein